MYIRPDNSYRAICGIIVTNRIDYSMFCVPKNVVWIIMPLKQFYYVVNTTPYDWCYMYIHSMHTLYKQELPELDLNVCLALFAMIVL